MKNIIQSIENVMFNRFSKEASGHDWQHIQRVRNMALHLQQIEGGDKTIVEMAALLHDIADHKFNDGDYNKGGIVAKEFLINLGVSTDIIEKVTTIVNEVSFKGSADKMQPSSLEGMIVQDADRLDAIGAIGIARTFAYGGSTGQSIYDPEVPPQKNQSKTQYAQNRSHTINHFYEKLLLIGERMNTETGKLIALERTEFMQNFLTQFYNEWNFALSQENKKHKKSTL